MNEDPGKLADEIRTTLALLNSQISVAHYKGIRMEITVDSGTIGNAVIDPPHIQIENMRLKL